MPDNGREPNVSLAPHSVDAEECTLGSLFMNPAAFAEVAAVVKPDDFFIIRNGWIFEAMTAVYSRAKTFDTQLIASELETRGRLADVGGEAYLRYLPSVVPTALHAALYAGVVQRAAVRRGLIVAASRIAALANNSSVAVEDALAEARAIVGDSVAAYHDAEFTTALEATESIYNEIKSGIDGGIKTGFRDIDVLFRRGLRRGQVWTVAGRPAMGKSAFALRVAANVAMGKSTPDGKPGRVLIFSREMTAYDHQIRLVSEKMGLSINAVESLTNGCADWQRFIDACDSVGYLNIVYDDQSSTIEQIEAAVTIYSAQFGPPDLIIVDRIDLVVVDGQVGEADTAALTTACNRMLDLSKQAAPVLMVAQLNRDVEKRTDKRPQLSDLRQSGALEQISYAVLMLYRPAYYDEAADENEARVIVRKNRQGATGDVQLFFRPELTGFYDIKWSTN